MEEPPGANPPPVGRRTLYIRHVPDDVAERLEKLASRAGVPLSTFALQELSETARRADNADLLNGLPTDAIDPALILDLKTKLDALKAAKDELAALALFRSDRGTASSRLIPPPSQPRPH